jgi:hypothetical protein
VDVKANVGLAVKGSVLGLLFLLCACGSTKANSTANEKSSSTASPLTTPTAQSSLTGLTFSCKLPISQPQSSGNAQGAFISFPSGTIAIAPDSSYQQPVPNRPFRSVAQPSLNGWPQEMTFTRRYGRWLPASLSAVSPDSSHYAYREEVDSPTRHYRIHAVDVRSGMDRVVYDQGFYVVFDYESDGIYLAATAGTGEGQAGLWLADPRQLHSAFT